MTSLFTNIPLSETIKLTVDLTKTSQPDLNITKKYLASLFNVASCETYFYLKVNFMTKVMEKQWGHLEHQFWLVFLWITMKKNG